MVGWFDGQAWSVRHMWLLFPKVGFSGLSKSTFAIGYEATIAVSTQIAR